jgi:hypothetical protein
MPSDTANRISQMPSDVFCSKIKKITEIARVLTCIRRGRHMFKNPLETLKAVIEEFGVFLVFLRSILCLGFSKLATRFRVMMLTISTILYEKP